MFDRNRNYCKCICKATFNFWRQFSREYWCPGKNWTKKKISVNRVQSYFKCICWCRISSKVPKEFLGLCQKVSGRCEEIWLRWSINRLSWYLYFRTGYCIGVADRFHQEIERTPPEPQNYSYCLGRLLQSVELPKTRICQGEQISRQ